MRSGVSFSAILVSSSICLTLVFTAATLARPVTDAERQSLETKVASFSAALQTNAFDALADATPPHIFDYVSKTAKVEPSRLRSLIV